MVTINIFAISPDYMDALYKEAISFDFALQGYGNPDAALKGLCYTNISDVIGFLYMASRLPKNVDALRRFLFVCDKMASDNGLTFLFALNSKQNPWSMLGLEEYTNLRFSTLTAIDDVTDTLIKRDIFGSLLLSRFEPYDFREKQEILDKKQPIIPVLEYRPVFSSLVLKVLEPSVGLMSLTQTLKADAIYCELLQVSRVASDIRRFVIMRRIGMDTERLKKSLDRTINDIDDPTSYCNYRALLQLAAEEEVANVV